MNKPKCITTVALPVYAEYLLDAVPGNGEICPDCGQPMWGTMAAVRFWISVGSKELQEQDPVPVACDSCCGDEYMQSLPRNPEKPWTRPSDSF